MRLFEKISRRRLGVTKPNILAELKVLEAISPIDEIATEVLAITVMAELQKARADEWCKANDVGVDFDALLEFIAMVIEMLMPFIVKARAPIPAYTYES